MRLAVHLVTAVWGEEYSRLFLQVLVPSLFTPGNLPALCRAMDARVRIFTLAGEARRFEDAPELARLRELVAVDVVEVALPPPEVTHSGSIGAMVQLHRRGIEDAERAGAAMLFLSPDIVFADGAFETVVRLAGRGKRAIMIAGLRLAREEFLAEYPRLRDAAGPQGLRPRELVSLALRHLHPLTQALVWGGPTLAQGTTMLLWKVGDAGLLGRFFHLHPLFVHPERRGTPVSSSVDDAYVADACPDPRTIAIIDDSDDLVLFELTSTSAGGAMGWTPDRRSVMRVVQWAHRGASALHRDHFRRRIAFRAAGGSPRRWLEARLASDAVARAVLTLLRLRFGHAPDALHRARAAVTAGVVRAKSALGIEGSVLGGDERERTPRA